MVIDKNELKDISNAEALFLNNTNNNEYVIELHKENEVFRTIKFDIGNILGYNIASFCWGTDINGKQLLVEVVSECSSCPKNSSKSLKKEKKQNIKKFTRL